MNNTTSVPRIVSIYNSLNKSQKGLLRKGFTAEFGVDIQAFDRKRRKNFIGLPPAEKKWIASFLISPVEELFQSQ